MLSIPAALSTKLVVHYTLKGSAANGTDYVLRSGRAKIKAGTTTKAIKIIPQSNLGGAAKKVVKITLANSTRYVSGTTKPVKITITND